MSSQVVPFSGLSLTLTGQVYVYRTKVSTRLRTRSRENQVFFLFDLRDATVR